MNFLETLHMHDIEEERIVYEVYRIVYEDITLIPNVVVSLVDVRISFPFNILRTNEWLLIMFYIYIDTE